MNLNPIAFDPPITSHIRSQHIANINFEQDTGITSQKMKV